MSVQVLEWGTGDGVEKVVAYLESLPSQDDRDYELSITRTAERSPAEVFEACSLIAADKGLPTSSRFGAAFVLATHFRRFKSYSDFARLIDQYSSDFAKEPLYPHVAALMYSGRGGPGDLEQALVLSRQASKALRNHTGALHAFASNVAHVAEAGGQVNDQLLAEAQEALATAVGLEPTYAKFYCTRGRLLALRGEYPEARASIQRAMDLEDEHKTDYALRLGEYQHHLARVFVREMSSTLEHEVKAAAASIDSTSKDVTRQLEEFRGQNLATLGLFTAILSFTLGSLQIVQGQSFDDAARLIIVLAGALLTVYGVFAMIVRRSSSSSNVPLVACTFTGVAIVMTSLMWR